MGYFRKVLGLPVDLAEEGLAQFWKEYQRLFQNHPVFHQYVPLQSMIPYYLHGDGGRGYKKDPIEKLSMFPALGCGTRKRPVELVGHKRRREQDTDTVDMGVNLAGSSGTSRFLFSVLSSLVYKQHPESFDALNDLWGQRLQTLFSDGFQALGSTWHVAIIGFTGDSPFVKKVAHFTRSFSNVRKHHAARNTDQKGCCWLCKAGFESAEEQYPFEHLGYWEPKWVATQGANNPLPWVGGGGPLLQYMMLGTDAPAFF